MPLRTCVDAVLGSRSSRYVVLLCTTVCVAVLIREGFGALIEEEKLGQVW